MCKQTLVRVNIEILWLWKGYSDVEGGKRGVMKGGGVLTTPPPNAYADRRRKGSKNEGDGGGGMMVFGDKKFEKGSQLCAEMV